MIKKIFKYYSNFHKLQRKNLIWNRLHPIKSYRILDFGGSDGKFLSILFPDFPKENLYVADISEKDLYMANLKFGYNTLLLDESGKIPFEDNYFDIIICNSVIEHVTMNKIDCYKVINWEEFNMKSSIRQKLLGDEIKRCGKSYFVQTPYRYFPIESHTWFPFFFIFLNRKSYIKFLNLLNKYWIKKSTPDWKLLTLSQMESIFPNAEIIKEKSFMLTKSIIAISKNKKLEI